MKADGITLSTVGAGGGANPFLEQLAQRGGGRFYAAVNPSTHPRHLPQGDPAGLRPADRRGAVLPDPDLELADPARPRGRPAAAPWLQRDDDQVGRPERARHRRATIRSSPSGSTAWADRSPGRPTRPGAGRRTGSAGAASTGSSASSCRGRSRARRPAASRRRFETTGGKTALHVAERRAGRLAARLLLDQRGHRRAGSRAAHGETSSRWRRGSTRRRSARSTAGAYAVRISQTRPGSSPLGRTVGLVAPTAAEYRLLGANEPFLAALRSATGGTVVTTPTRPVDPRPRPPRTGSPSCGRCSSSSRSCCGRSTSRCAGCRWVAANSLRRAAGSPGSRAAGARANPRTRRRPRSCSRPAAASLERDARRASHASRVAPTEHRPGRSRPWRQPHQSKAPATPPPIVARPRHQPPAAPPSAAAAARPRRPTPSRRLRDCQASGPRALNGPGSRAPRASEAAPVVASRRRAGRPAADQPSRAVL